jgi:hypothetical protein
MNGETRRIEALEGGMLELTILGYRDHLEISEGDPNEPRTALLTARGGKDFDLDAAQLEALGHACLEFAARIREER